jgi:lycopene beta-cyclase
MSDYPFHRLNTPSHIRIGTGGGWVKPSSGYSFKNSGRNVVRIISNLKNGRNPAAGIGSNKFRFYDGVFLEVLYHRNELGEEIFNDMYSKNPPERIFRFLDEETSLSDDLKVITSFRSGPFISALGRLVSRLF